MRSCAFRSIPLPAFRIRRARARELRIVIRARASVPSVSSRAIRAKPRVSAIRTVRGVRYPRDAAARARDRACTTGAKPIRRRRRIRVCVACISADPSAYPFRAWRGGVVCIRAETSISRANARDPARARAVSRARVSRRAREPYPRARVSGPARSARPVRIRFRRSGTAARRVSVCTRIGLMRAYPSVSDVSAYPYIHHDRSARDLYRAVAVMPCRISRAARATVPTYRIWRGVFCVMRHFAVCRDRLVLYFAGEI